MREGETRRKKRGEEESLVGYQDSSLKLWKNHPKARFSWRDCSAFIISIDHSTWASI
ncbi:unnamed protein product [Camellia sinensis]